jgi:hypothetical protein
MCLVAYLDELRGDAYAGTVGAGAAFNHVIHSKLFPDLLNALGDLPVFVSRSPRDHTQAIGVHASELSDEFLGHAITEVLLPGLVAHGLEGEHNQHDSLWVLRHLPKMTICGVADSQYYEGDQYCR